MDDIVWLYASIWIALLVIGLSFRKEEITIMGAVVGILFGLSLLAESLVLSLALVIINFVLIVAEVTN